MTAGVDVPDGRGRTGLHRTGLDLHRNRDVVVREVEVLSCDWYVLRATTFDQRLRDGTWVRQRRETYDRGDGAAILLHDATRGTVLLTRQFRYPAYVNAHPDGMLLEVPAGLLDADDAESAIRREATEETGVVVGEVTAVGTFFMSPGSVTERLHLFAASYRRAEVGSDRTHGDRTEGEDIELVELDAADALRRIGHDVVDAKTVMLLQWAALRGLVGR